MFFMDNKHTSKFLKKVFLFFTCLFSLFTTATFGQEKQRFLNPILAGFYPDPAICRVGEDYYLVLSSFAYFPGVPIFHSKDLVNWNQIGNILDRPEQLNLDNHGVSRGIFAPTLSYHNGVYYMITTLIDRGGNFVVTATNPAGPWSNPVWLRDVHGIDPSLFFDDDGKAYVIYNGNPPDNKSLYEGHRTIRMQEFDYKNLKTTSPSVVLVNGGVDISKKPVWIEGPHIYKKDGYYYLMAAEGGTSVNHSEVILRSKKVNADYQPNPNNPILTQRHLPANRKNPVSATGHADLVQTQNGEWWAVFLATRPYTAQDHYNIGRETFLAPVSWKDGWPVINPGFDEVQYSYTRPQLPAGPSPKLPLNGNFTYKEDFNAGKLPQYWLMLRTPRSDWYSLSKPSGYLTLHVRPETISGKGNPSFMVRRQQHITGNASTKMNFKPASADEFAGLVTFQNETHYYALGKTISQGKVVVQLRKSEKADTGGPETSVLAETPLKGKDIRKPLYLKVDFQAGKYAFYYGTKEGAWTLLQDKVDGTFLSTRTAGGFVGVNLGLYATSQGKPSANQASFDWFDYQGNDSVYQTTTTVEDK
jgi:xylan 1,4-beta-xylosidase